MVRLGTKILQKHQGPAAHRSERRSSSRHHSKGGRSICWTNQADGETQLSSSSAQSLCILGVGVDTRRVPAPKSASTATVPQTETMRPKP